MSYPGEGNPGVIRGGIGGEIGGREVVRLAKYFPAYLAHTMGFWREMGLV